MRRWFATAHPVTAEEGAKILAEREPEQPLHCDPNLRWNVTFDGNTRGIIASAGPPALGTGVTGIGGAGGPPGGAPIAVVDHTVAGCGRFRRRKTASVVVAGIGDLKNKRSVWLRRRGALHLLDHLLTLVSRRAEELVQPPDRHWAVGELGSVGR